MVEARPAGQSDALELARIARVRDEVEPGEVVAVVLVGVGHDFQVLRGALERARDPDLVEELVVAGKPKVEFNILFFFFYKTIVCEFKLSKL